MRNHRRLLATAMAVVVVTTSALHAKSSHVITVTACDLVGRPLEFANHRIRVRGTICRGPGFSTLVGTACPSGTSAESSIWLELPDIGVIEKYERGWSVQRYIKA